MYTTNKITVHFLTTCVFVKREEIDDACININEDPGERT